MKHFRQQKRPKKSQVIGGSRAVRESILTGENIERLFIQKNLVLRHKEIGDLAAKHALPVNFVPVEKLNSFNVDHDGCLALRSRITYQDVQEIVSAVFDRGEAPLLLLLDGITDVRNIGAIARTAYAMGVHALVIPDKGVASLNEDAILTSAGALEVLPVCRVNSLMKTVDDLHSHGIKVFATDMQASVAISEANFTEPVAIVMGSEEKGIYPALVKVCDEKVRIPMVGDFESLNVSVATGMVLYEVVQQRQHK